MTRPLVFDVSGRHLTIQLAVETVAGLLPSSLRAFWLELGEWRKLEDHELARLQVTVGLEVTCQWCEKGYDCTVQAPCTRCSGKGQRFDPMRAAVHRGSVVMAARLLEPKEARLLFHRKGDPWRSGEGWTAGDEAEFRDGRSGAAMTYEDRMRRERDWKGGAK